MYSGYLDLCAQELKMQISRSMSPLTHSMSFFLRDMILQRFLTYEMFKYL